MFLAVELYSHLGLHTKLYQPPIPSLLSPALDCSTQDRQTVQLRRQPLWGVDLRAMLDMLQAGYQAHRPVISIVWRIKIQYHCRICRMKLRTDIYVAGRRDECDVQVDYIPYTRNISGLIVFGKRFWIHWIKTLTLVSQDPNFSLTRQCITNNSLALQVI